jgi:hypothetical protein
MSNRRNEVAMFEAILNTQGAALEKLMSNQPTANPTKMDLAKQRLEEAICLAIQASKEVTDEVN